MDSYQMMYYVLFNAVTNATQALAQGQGEIAKKVLITAQQSTEEIFMNGKDETPEQTM